MDEQIPLIEEEVLNTIISCTYSMRSYRSAHMNRRWMTDLRHYRALLYMANFGIWALIICTRVLIWTSDRS